jgi:phosphoribosylamine--glycine ligase
MFPYTLTDFKRIGDFCIENQIDTLLPGGEDTLVAGIGTSLKKPKILKHIFVFGPDKAWPLN